VEIAKIFKDINIPGRSKEILGIQYSETLFKVVAIKKEKNKISISEFPFEVMIPEETPPGVAIKEALLSRSIKTKECVFSIPISYTLIKNIKLPSMPQKEIREAVEWNIREDLKAIKGETYFDFDIISEDDGFLNIVVVIAKLSDIEKLISIANDANLNLKIIDSSAIGLINLTLKQKEKIGDEEKENFCVIHIDKDESFLSFLQNGITVQTLDFNIKSYPNYDLTQKEEAVSKLINEINYFFLTVNEPKQIYLSGYFTEFPEIKTVLDDKFSDKFQIINLDPAIALDMAYLADEYKGPYNIPFSAALRGLEEW